MQNTNAVSHSAEFPENTTHLEIPTRNLFEPQQSFEEGVETPVLLKRAKMLARFFWGEGGKRHTEVYGLQSLEVPLFRLRYYLGPSRSNLGACELSLTALQYTTSMWMTPACT